MVCVKKSHDWACGWMWPDKIICTPQIGNLISLCVDCAAGAEGFLLTLRQSRNKCMWSVWGDIFKESLYFFSVFECRNNCFRGATLIRLQRNFNMPRVCCKAGREQNLALRLINIRYALKFVVVSAFILHVPQIWALVCIVNLLLMVFFLTVWQRNYPLL